MINDHSIFGYSESKFIFEGTDVFLTHSTIDKKFYPDYEVNQGLFTGDRDFKTQGYNSEYKVKIQIHKNADVIGTFEDLYQYNHKDVYFFPHSDGEPIKTGDATATQSFHITNMDLTYVDKYGVYDVLDITFKSNGYSSYEFKALPPGSGTEEDPYLIYDSDDMNNVRNFGTSYWKVVRDFNMSDYPDWVPITTVGAGFSLDGNNKVITGLTQTTLRDYNGLFGRINYASGFVAIKNITLNSASVYFTSGDTSAARYIGGLVGNMNLGNASNFSNNRIRNSIVGLNFSLQAYSTQWVGGLIGRVNSSAGSIVSCSVENSSIRRQSSGVIAQEAIGGFAGWSNVPINTSFVNDCNIISARNDIYAHIAGFIGTLAPTGVGGNVINCYVANSTIISAPGEMLSGFVAAKHNDTPVRKCYAAVSYTGYSDIADVSPFYSDTLSGASQPTDCYYDSGTIEPGHEDGGGVTPLSSSQAQDSASYTNWDFENVWSIDAEINNGYPYLKGHSPS